MTVERLDVGGGGGGVWSMGGNDCDALNKPSGVTQ